jgi:hypothetical protein
MFALRSHRPFDAVHVNRASVKTLVSRYDRAARTMQETEELFESIAFVFARR